MKIWPHLLVVPATAIASVVDWAKWHKQGRYGLAVMFLGAILILSGAAFHMMNRETRAGAAGGVR